MKKMFSGILLLAAFAPSLVYAVGKPFGAAKVIANEVAGISTSQAN